MLKNNSGFTLIEILLVILIIITLTSFSAPVLQSFQTRNDLHIAKSIIIANLHRAQLLSQANLNDQPWSININKHELTLFQGTNYITRDTNYDEISDLPKSITPSGLSKITFTKLDGVPVSTGTINLTSNTNIIKSLTINEKGIIQ